MEKDIAQRFDRFEKFVRFQVSKTDKRYTTLTNLIESLAEVTAKNFDRIDLRLDGIDGRLDAVESRLESVENKIEGIGRRIDHEAEERGTLERRVEKLKKAPA